MPAIEQRVVEMKFDNKNFDSNIRDSINSLDNLKNSLALTEASKGLQDLQRAGDRFDLHGMEDAAGRVQNALSQLAVNGLQSIQNLSTRASAELSKMFNQMTIEPITAGWSKYADKTQAIQTIMAATSKQWADESERMEKVQEQLGVLNWFTDETSYKFLDMVNNIGKFTSAGVELQDAVTAMQGISTWASVSGANVNEAGRAMYNLSQAMATGKVKLMDWKSIENANMATVEFKETVIDTAEKLGELTKVGDHWVVKGTKMEVTAKNFNESLAKGWFTSEVLMTSLNKYGHASELIHDLAEETDLAARDIVEMTESYRDGFLDINEASEETGLSVEELTKKLKVLASDEEALGLKAFKAAYETKTFQEAIDYVKESASSLWMQIYENIFGNYVETKKIWGALVDELYEIFLVPLEGVNDLLGSWHELGGFEDFWAAIGNIWSTVKSIARPISEAWNLIFPPMLGYQLADLTKKFRNWTEGLSKTFGWAGSLKNTIAEPFFKLQKAEALVAQKAAEMKAGFEEIAEAAEKVLDPVEETNKAVKTLVDEVWAGKWGHGSDRIKNLREAGYVYEIVQNAVNEGAGSNKRYAVTEEAIAAVTKKTAKAEKDLADKTDKTTKKVEEASKKRAMAVEKTNSEKARQVILDETIEEVGYGAHISDERRAAAAEKIAKGREKVLSLYEDEERIQETILDDGEKLDKVQERAKRRVENIHKTAAGIFAVVALIKDAVSEAGKMLMDVGGYLLDKLQPTFDLILDITGELGEAAVHFYVLNKQANTIGKAFAKVGDALKKVIDGVFAGFNAFIEHVRNSDAWKHLTDTWKRLTDIFKELYDKVLTKIGDFFGNTDFEKSGEKVGKSLASIAELAIDKLADALDWLIEHKEEIGQFFGIFTNGLANVIESVGKALGGVGDAISSKGVVGAISFFFGAIGEGIKKAISGVGNIISSEQVQELWNKIGERFSNFDFGQMAKVFATGAGGALLFSLAKLISGIAGGIGDAVKSLKEIPEKIVGVLDGLVGALQAYQMRLKADVLWKIAKSIGVLAVALFILSLVPQEELENATASLVAVMGAVMGIMAIYTKMKGLKVDAKNEALSIFLSGIEDALKKAIKMAGMGVMMVGFGITVAILIGALFLLMKIDWMALLSNVGKLLIIVGILVAAMAALNILARNMPKGMGGALIGFAVSVIALAGAMLLIAKIPQDQLWSVTGAMAALIAMMAIFAAAMSLNDNGSAFIGFGIGILAIAAALAVLAIPLAILSAIPWDNLKHAADILGGLLLALVAAAVIMKVFQTSGKALINLAVALLVLGGALALVGLVALPAALGLGIIAGAIVLLIAGTLLLGGLGPMLETFVASIYAVSAAAVNFALAALALAAALLVLGIALPTLANGLVAFGEQLRKHGLEIALAIGAIILTVLAAIGAATVLNAFKSVVVEWVKTMTKALAEATPSLLKSLGMIIFAALLFLEAILPGIVDKLLDMLATILESLARGIRENGPRLLIAAIDIVLAIFEAILVTVWNYIGPLMQPIFTFFSWIWNAVWPVLSPLVAAIGGFFYTVYDFFVFVCQLIGGAFTWLWDKITGWFDAVRDKFSWLTDSIDWVGEKLGSVFGGGKEKAEEAGAEMPGAMADSVEASAGDAEKRIAATVDSMTTTDPAVVQENADETSNAYINRFNTDVENAQMGQPGFEDWLKQNGKTLGDGGAVNAEDYAGGFTSFLGADTSIPSSVTGVVNTSGQQGSAEAKAQGTTTGKEYDNGIILGIDSNSGPVVEKVKDLARKMKESANAELDSHSPSREAAKIARFFDLGLVKGLEDNSRYVEQSTRNVARKMLTCINSVSDDVDAMFEDGINTNPVISPILDLENIQNGVHGIDDLFSGTSFAMSGSLGGVRTPNEIMEMRMGRMFQQQFDSLADRITDSDKERAYEFTIPVEIDGRQVARSTAVYTNEELDKINRRTNRKAGIV